MWTTICLLAWGRGFTHWKYVAYAITPKCSTFWSAMSFALRIGSTPSFLPPSIPSRRLRSRRYITRNKSIGKLTVGCRLDAYRFVYCAPMQTDRYWFYRKPEPGRPNSSRCCIIPCRRSNRSTRIDFILKKRRRTFVARSFHREKGRLTVKFCTGWWGNCEFTHRNVAWKPGEPSFMKYDK